MKVKALFPLFILLFVFNASPTMAQCSMKLADLPVAPELLGFKLGMTAEEIKSRVPQVAFGRANEFGLSKTSINPDFDARFDKSTFPGVRTVSLDLLDGRLISLWLGYDSSFKWKTVEDFVKGISESLHLPHTWSPWRSRGKQLNCTDFQMTVMFVAEGPSFRIIDQNAEQTVAARREALDEMQSAATEESSEEIIADRRGKLYFPAGCEPPEELKESDRVVFKTKDEAEKAGYKPAKSCPLKSDQP